MNDRPRAVPDPEPRRPPLTAERWRTLAPPTRVVIWAASLAVAVVCVGVPLVLLWRLAP